MTTCREWDALLPLHAEGVLDPAEAARLDAHLSGCAGCRAGLEAYAGALSLARLPPLSEAERAAASGLAGSVLAAHGRSERRRRFARRGLLGLSAAAAVAAAAVAPSLLRPSPAPPSDPTLVADAGWQEPDLDEIWDATDVIDWSE
ncbi:MAG TPA: zf-HC2 domain-containing protein [Anaeromyxobacteraceae bacterium]|nr:zf-HC2 domain-containing protein [Anaeromyxobacteraceae bacterium]